MYSLIVSTPGTRSGEPRIDGHRITVRDVAYWYHCFGWTVDKIARDYRLTYQQVYAALDYYDEYRTEIDRLEAEASAFIEAMRLKVEATPQHVELRRRMVEYAAKQGL